MSKPLKSRNVQALPSRRQKRNQSACANGNSQEPFQPQEVFDLDESLRRLDEDHELFGHIVRIFLETCPGVLEDLHIALSREDPQSLTNAAHNIKGMVAAFGAKTAFDAARRLEQIGRGGDLGRASEVLAELEKQIFSLQSALNRPEFFPKKHVWPR